MKFFLCILSIFTGQVCCLQNRVTIIIDSLPETKDTIYMAGSFNSWVPANNNYAFINKKLVLSLPKGDATFKLTRGSWQKVEAAIDGSPIENRQLNVQKDSVIHVSVKAWADNFAKKELVHTASEQVIILDTSFYIPQLNRYRRIWAYLPKNYNRDVNKRYPVLYMQDGQNLFDATTAFSGEWGVDEFLDSTKLPPAIVVGIDNGGEKRMQEYNPYDNPKFGKGEGNEYIDFLAKNLKPFIDNHYRTLKNAENTIVAGSSMGGLISLCAVIKYPEVFGKAGIFSPAFWVAGDQFYRDIAALKKTSAKLYFYGGGLEGSEMTPNMLRVEKILQKAGATVKIKVKKTGRHNEAEWSRQFPMFYKWVIR